MSHTQGSQDLGKAILRIVLGVLILLHGISKVMAGPGFVVQVVTEAGLPAVAVLSGLYRRGGGANPADRWSVERAAALIVVVNMLFAFGWSMPSSWAKWRQPAAGRWSCRGCTWRARSPWRCSAPGV
jgi:uncharacterized membrane protein YphA (DoxX/SURF4 family)